MIRPNRRGGAGAHQGAVRMTEDEFTSEEGLQIVTRAGAAQGTPRAVVAICHRLISHSGQ